PTTYADSNDRSNDPLDHDAVCWMLEQPGVADSWTYHNLFECARKQRNRIENDLNRVIDAANLCRSIGVEQRELHDPRIGKDGRSSPTNGLRQTGLSGLLRRVRLEPALSDVRDPPGERSSETASRLDPP